MIRLRIDKNRATVWKTLSTYKRRGYRFYELNILGKSITLELGYKTS